MGPIFVYAIIGVTCVAGVLRPFWGLVGYLFLLFLQPEWNWRWDGLYGVQYQKPIIISILIGSLIHKRPKRLWQNWSLLSIACLLFFLCCVFISWTASNHPSIGEVYVDVIWKTVIVVILLIMFVDTPDKAIIATWAGCLGSGYNALRINEDYLSTGVTRWINNSWGYKGDSNIYTLYSLPFLFSSIVFIFTSRSMLLRLVAAGLSLLQVHQIMLLESRGGLLALVAGASTVVYFVKKTIYINTALAFIATVALLLAGPPVMREFNSIFASAEERDSSAASRLVLWSTTSKIIVDNPFLGVGPNATQLVIPKYAAEFSDSGIKHPHNVFLEIASGSGIPALIAFLGFLLLPVIHALRRMWFFQDEHPSHTATQLSLISTVFGFCVGGMFAGSGLIESIYLMMAVWIGQMVNQENSETSCGDDELFEEETADEIETLSNLRRPLIIS